MTSARPTALIADDEPLLREALARQLAQAWPELEIVAEARNGREAVKLFEAKRPDVCFLDVQMPGVSGVEAARQIGRQAHLVFVTAFDHYAVQAFAQGVLDYLVKPVELARLAETVARLQGTPARPLGRRPTPRRCSRSSREQLARMQAASRHRAAALDSRAGRPYAAAHLDRRHRLPARRQQVHADRLAGRRRQAGRGAGSHAARANLPRGSIRRSSRRCTVRPIVNLRAIDHVRRGDNETADIHLKGRPEVLPVSRNFLHLFKQM